MAKLYIGDSQGTPAIIKIEEVSKKKLGASIDNLLGDVDENGAYQVSTEPFTLDLSSVKSVPSYALYYKFYYSGVSGTLTIGLEGDLNGNYAMNNCFHGCTGLTSVDLSSLTAVSGSSALYYCFGNCTGLTSVDLSSLTTVSGSNAMSYCFGTCTGLTSVDLSSLTIVSGSSALSACFSGCKGLSTISFPALTSIGGNSFGSASYNYTFNGCTALAEIHFRADMQATIEALDGYKNKFGAKNATIYFDLIGTITVNGVAYSRNEPNSIRVDGNKTFVAWKDASDNIVYTNATAEPAVDTPVYSDQGTTQVGTVSEVA